VAIAVELNALLVIIGGFFVASTASGVLLLRMRQLGWTMTMLLTGIALAYGICAWFFAGSTLSIVMLVQVVTVFYLNQRQVRQAFGISVATKVQRSIDPRNDRSRAPSAVRTDHSLHEWRVLLSDARRPLLRRM
jgi:hypothetical protein